MEAHGPPPLLHRTADFRGAPTSLLHDGTAIAGLLLSAAGAAGLSTFGPPVIRTLPREGVAVVVLLDLGHMSVHTIPSRELLALDLLVAAGRDPQRAVDVFVRKLGVSEARTARLDRG